MAFVSDLVIAGLGDGSIHRTNLLSDTAPIAETFTPTGPCEVLEIRIHLSAAGGAGDLTVTLNSGIGAAYDALLRTVGMTTATDVVITDAGFHLASGDAIDIDWANAGTRLVGIEVVWRAF